MSVHTFNPKHSGGRTTRNSEFEANLASQVSPYQPGLHNETLSQRAKQTKGITPQAYMSRKNSIYTFGVVPNSIHPQRRVFVTHLLVKGGTTEF